MTGIKRFRDTCPLTVWQIVSKLVFKRFMDDYSLQAKWFSGYELGLYSAKGIYNLNKSADCARPEKKVPSWGCDCWREKQLEASVEGHSRLVHLVPGNHQQDQRVVHVTASSDRRLTSRGRPCSICNKTLQQTPMRNVHIKSPIEATILSYHLTRGGLCISICHHSWPVKKLLRKLTTCACISPDWDTMIEWMCDFSRFPAQNSQIGQHHGIRRKVNTNERNEVAHMAAILASAPQLERK